MVLAKPNQDMEFIAGVDLTEYQYHIVATDKASSKSKIVFLYKGGLIKLLQGNHKEGNVPVGILRNAPTKGEQAVVKIFDDFAEALNDESACGMEDTATGDKAHGTAGERLSAIVRSKMVLNKSLSYSEAFAQVCREQPTLTKEYANSL